MGWRRGVLPVEEGIASLGLEIWYVVSIANSNGLSWSFAFGVCCKLSNGVDSDFGLGPSKTCCLTIGYSRGPKMIGRRVDVSQDSQLEQSVRSYPKLSFPCQATSPKMVRVDGNQASKQRSSQPFPRPPLLQTRSSRSSWLLRIVLTILSSPESPSLGSQL